MPYTLMKEVGDHLFVAKEMQKPTFVFFDLEEEVKTDPSMTLKDLVPLQLEMSVGKNLSFDIPSLESPFNEKDSFGKCKLNGVNLVTLSIYF